MAKGLYEPDTATCLNLSDYACLCCKPAGHMQHSIDLLAADVQAFTGDDTWMQLFPHQFHNAKPYSSFNVMDLHTVDDGVWQVGSLAFSPSNAWSLLRCHNKLRLKCNTQQCAAWHIDALTSTRDYQTG